MVKYDKKTNEIVVTERFSWEYTVLPIIKAVKASLDDDSDYSDFKQWEPNKEEIVEIMEQVVDDVSNAEDDQDFDAHCAIQESVTSWINENFNIEINRYTIGNF